MNTTHTILTGDRPTGQLHLGHYVGSLRQRVALQQTHSQFVLIADLQGLTDNGSNPQKIRDNIPEVLADYLAAGIDPNLTTLCLQSALVQRAGWAIAGEDGGCVHKDSLMCSCRKGS
jgi:tryptophanyl-tRNA synthetase